MTNLKRSLRINSCLCLTLLGIATASRADVASNGTYDLTKVLIGASGGSQTTSADYSVAFAIGEDAAGTESRSIDYDLISGYFSGYPSGYSGTFSLVSAAVGTTKIMQSGYQVGVPLNASAQLVFSSPLDPSTLAAGIQVNLLMDHLGNPQNEVIPSTYSYTVIGTTVVISAQGSWSGNTLYDIIASSGLRSTDGFALTPSTPTAFITVLDPRQENVVLQPIPSSLGLPASSPPSNAPSLSLDMPTGSLSDFAYVLISQDPIHQPILASPVVIEQATQKAQASGGAYETPLALEELVAYNQQGQLMNLIGNATFSINYGAGPNLTTPSGVPIYPNTLSLWSLDSVHALWVRMPDSHPAGSSVTGSLTQFAVYALMGGAEGNASDVAVFPDPWRPHGPMAGTGSGQSGTEAGGLTFTNLPSECSIKIYTLSGRLVETLTHSDINGAIGQETWNGRTVAGDIAASGVYLWRVESSGGGENGKLMIIR